jgi:hypothetical protein
MLSTKDPRETITITFDFSAVAKIISTATVTVSVHLGTDDNPQAILEDTPQILNNNKVLQQFRNGFNEVNYLITVSALSETGEQFIHTDILRVRSEPYTG